MKVSIITVTFNSASTIRDTIDSVIAQDYANIEHIIVDGASKDGTLDIVKSYSNKISRIISEPDNGIYDAMNKGIRVATGDIVGILNSDDFFTSSDVISTIAESFTQNNIDALYGDIHFVHPDNLNKPVRYYSSKIFKPSLFCYGFMPAHPSFYMKKSCYDLYGLYALDYKIASDYDLLIRYLYKYKVKYQYIKKDFVTMRTGGVSTENMQSRIVLNREIIRACNRYGIKTNMLLLSLKYLYKIFELR
ncbi:MAG: glycosyltransferase family 2 protein [Proteiniphilum sp.]|uniref:glycosyltransferase family 2 protein n=1 Tax=Proteiniphilum sp. TaxID=1926877 RepID=UPI002B21D19C|nr:glycosyltransferase family 2 protein [Proteiniphilum sp.]MEA5127282.1 glycosyltransferase family 2 protein [Proteiniphilum sp.]